VIVYRIVFLLHLLYELAISCPVAARPQFNLRSGDKLEAVTSGFLPRLWFSLKMIRSVSFSSSELTLMTTSPAKSGDERLVTMVRHNHREASTLSEPPPMRSATWIAPSFFTLCFNFFSISWAAGFDKRSSLSCRRGPCDVYAILEKNELFRKVLCRPALGLLATFPGPLRLDSLPSSPASKLMPTCFRPTYALLPFIFLFDLCLSAYRPCWASLLTPSSWVKILVWPALRRPQRGHPTPHDRNISSY